MLARMLTLGDGATWLPWHVLPSLVLLLVGHWAGKLFEQRVDGSQSRGWLDGVIAFFGARLLSDPISGYYLKFGMGTVGGALLCSLWFLAIWYFAPLNTSPFIYFQF
jgi:hypothetical protein